MGKSSERVLPVLGSALQHHLLIAAIRPETPLKAAGFLFAVRMAGVMDPNLREPWWRDRVLWLIVLLAAVLRLAFLGHKSLWLDEAATFTLSTSSLHAFAREWWSREANATAYYMLERVWLHLGHSEWMLRLPSAVFGIVAVPAIYVFAKRVFGSQAAWIAALLLAVNPAHLEHSQDARAYTMAMCLGLISSGLLLKAIEEGGRRVWVAYVLIGALAVYAHVFAALVLVAQVASLVAVPREKLRWKPLLLAATGVMLLCGPVLIFFALQGHTVTTAWIAPVNAKQVFRLFQFYSGSGLKFILMAALWAAGMWRISRERQAAEGRWRVALLLSWIVVPILLAFAVSLRQSVFAFKYLMVALPPVIVLAVAGAMALPRVARWVIVAGLAMASCATIFTGYKKPIEDWRGLSAYVQQNFQSGDAIAFSPPYARNAMDYYWDRTGIHDLKSLAPKPLVGELEADAVAEANPAALLKACEDCRRVWLVEYGTDAPPPGAKERLRAMIAAMPDGDQLRQTNVFKNVRVYLFAP
jgi:mannosyltransferase